MCRNGEQNLQNVRITVVREHHWSPDTFNKLFLDSIDTNGLFFWYEDIVKVHTEMQTNSKK